ncbi:MAG: type V CRISPR-associated protein Cas12k [Nostoc sp. S4]|nr:type V CRISPR-associated protein Cas12k [Nostoc sp. S4]
MTLESFCNKAAEILAELTPQSDTVEAQPAKRNKRKKTKKSKASDSDCAERTLRERSISKTLFEPYRNTEDIVTRWAISYLLKNGCKINPKDEDAEKFANRRRKLEIQIERLREQLEARIPKGRDLTDAKWLETLLLATDNVPESEEEAKSWQDSLLKKSSKVPFLVAYEINEDMTWFKNERGRICLKFNGLGEHTFQVYCDSRHLHWFQRFLEDQQIKHNSKNQYSFLVNRSGINFLGVSIPLTA